MGKALLFIVAAIGAASIQTVVQANSVQSRSTVQQVIYQDDVIAYQVARAGYNVAYGMIHDAPTLAEGVALVNSATNGLHGTYLGGEYRVTAGFAGGETVVIQSHGYYGGRWSGGQYVGRYEAGRLLEPSHHFIGDDRQSVVFHADNSDGRPRRLTAYFMKSVAGYCSAIFVQRYLPGVAAAAQPAPEMMFEPGNTRNGATQAFEVDVMPGTQLNFFIAVDTNCDIRPNKIDAFTPAQRTAYVTEFNRVGRTNRGTVTSYLARFDHVHNALDVDVADLANLRESPWAMIEQHRSGRERWRIGWEDIHNTGWLTGQTPQTSLRLTKERGFNGVAWADTRVDGYNAETTAGNWSPTGTLIPLNQPDGYRDLTDHGSIPDFEDQVIEVSMAPIVGSPAAVSSPVRPPVAMPALVAGNGGCPAGKTPIDRPSTRDVGRSNRLCAAPAEVAALVAAGSTVASIASTTAPPSSTLIAVCHNGRTRTVTQNQLQAHLSHGDPRRACTNADNDGNG